MIPYGKQDISAEDIAAVVEVLKSDFITQGPVVPKFEDVLKDYVGADFAVAVNSATSALHIACLALGVGPGDEVWTSPNSFVASANCALMCGAGVDFVDIDANTYNISPDALEEKLKLGKVPKVLIPVHFAGQSCEMERIGKLAKNYGFKIIEDASHAIGGSYKDGKIGGCEYSDVTVFSFHPVKIITTGEGGMAVTNDAGLAEKMARLRTHGIVKKDLWNYEQVELGYNYRMTDIQSALGVSQMGRLDKFIARRHEIAKRYDDALVDLVQIPFQHPDTNSAYHLYPIVLDEPKRRKAVYEALRGAGIGTQVHYIPIHTQSYYKALGFKKGDFPAAEEYYAATLSLPMYSSLSDAEQDSVIGKLKEIIA